MITVPAAITITTTINNNYCSCYFERKVAAPV
jgi:hypothetical protein